MLQVYPNILQLKYKSTPVILLWLHLIQDTGSSYKSITSASRIPLLSLTHERGQLLDLPWVW